MFFKKKKEEQKGKNLYLIGSASLFILLKSNNKIETRSDLKSAFEELDEKLRVMDKDTAEIEENADFVFGKDKDGFLRVKKLFAFSEEKEKKYIHDIKSVLFFIVYCDDVSKFWRYTASICDDSKDVWDLIYSVLIYLGFDAELNYKHSIGRYIEC